MASEKIFVDLVMSDGKKAGNTLGELTSDARKLNSEIKKLPVGSAEFVKKSADLKKVNGRIKEVKGEIYGAQKSTQQLSGTFSELLAASPFGALAMRIQAMTGPLKGVTTGFKTLRGAIMATGIGALVVVLGSLISYLTSTQDGIDRVTAVTRPLRVIFERLKGVIQDFGAGIAAAFSDPVGSIKALGQMLVDNIINRFKAVGIAARGIAKLFKGEFSEGFSDLSEAAVQGVTGVENAVGKVKDAVKDVSDFVKEGIAQGAELDKLIKRTEQAEINLIKNRERLNAEYQKQREIAQDVSRGEEERLAAAQAAQAAQNQLLAMEQNFMDLKIERMKLEHTFNDTSREDYKELAELEGQRTAFEAQAARKRASAKALENQVVNQLSKEREAAEKGARDRQLAAEQALQDLRIELISDATEREIAKINLAHERKIEQLQGNETQIAEQQAMLEAQRLEKIEEIRRAKEEELTIEREELEKAQLEEKFMNALITEQEYQDQLYEVKRQNMERELELIRQQHGAESLEYQQHKNAILLLDQQQTTDRIDNEERMTAAKKDLEAKTFEAARDSIMGVILLLEQDESAKKKHANAIKALKVSQVISSGISEVQNIWERVADLGPVLGPIIGAIQTGIAVARTGMAISKLSGIKFSSGGVLTGPSHAQGGIKFFNPHTKSVDEAEGGEIILTKGVASDPVGRMLASNLNAMYGGRRFALGGPINPLTANTPSIPGSAAQAAMPTQITIPGLEEIANLRADMQAYHSNIASWQSNLKVHQNLNDVEEGLSVKQELEDDAGF